jgi:nucleoside-diphosphate-sugar epimerase
LLAAHSQGGIGEALNIAQGSCFSILDLVRLLERILERKLTTHHAAERAGDVRQTLADISRAAKALGYRPAVTFEEGIVRTVSDFVEHRI